MNDKTCDKLILAVVQGDDYQDVISELNRHGFYATVLHSSGGFLKKQSVTLMIGLRREELEEALQLLKRYGERTETYYQPLQPLILGHTSQSPGAAVPVPVRCGGVVLFVLDVERHERY